MGVAPPGVAALLGAIVLFTIALIGGALWLAAEQAQRRSVLGGFAKVESVAAGFQWGLRFLSLMTLTLGLPGARWPTRRAGLSQMLSVEGGGLMISFDRRLRMVRPPALLFFVRAACRSKKGLRLPES